MHRTSPQVSYFLHLCLSHIFEDFLGKSSLVVLVLYPDCCVFIQWLLLIQPFLKPSPYGHTPKPPPFNCGNFYFTDLSDLVTTWVLAGGHLKSHDSLPWMCASHIVDYIRKKVLEMGLFYGISMGRGWNTWPFPLCASPAEEKALERRYALSFSLFLRKNSQAELSVFVRLKSGRHNEVLSQGQLHAAGDFTQVDIRIRPGCRLVPCEESTVCMNICVIFQLWEMWFC